MTAPSALIWLAAIAPPSPSLPSPSPSAAPSTFGAGVIGFSFLLSLITWGPVLMAFVIALVPATVPLGTRGRVTRPPLGIAFWTSVGTAALTLIGYSQFQSFVTGVQFEERMPWIPGLGISYHLGADGISMAVLVTNQLVGLAAVIASWDVRERSRQYFALLLLTQAAVSGAAVARDFFLLFLFWSLPALTFALLAAGWGPRSGSAGARLIGIWGLGSAALLAAGLLIYRAAGAADFDLATLGQAQAPFRLQVVAGILLLVAAATRLPLLPLHGWTRELLAETPPGVAVLAAGSASRLGGYVLVRLLAGELHDGAQVLAPYVGVLAGLTAVFAGLAAMRDTDLRRLAAHLALIPGAVTALGVCGLTPLSLHGTVLSLFSGGLAAALLVGAAASVAQRAQVRSLAALSGLAGRLPVLSWLTLAGAIAALGLPFAATFPSQLMVLLGSFRRAPGASFAVAAGLVLGAAAVAWLAQRALFGTPSPDSPAALPPTLPDKWYLGILAGALLWVGLVPGGPRPFGIPLFDPGMVTVVNSATPDLASTYAPSPPPTPSPTPSSTAGLPTGSPSPSPSP